MSSNQVNAKPSKTPSGLLVICTYSTIALCVILFVIIVALEGTNKDIASLRAPSSCCVKEALEIVQRLNTSVDPCANFHDFVCTRRMTDMNSSDTSPLFRIAVGRANLESCAGASGSPSGRAFSQLHRSCKKQNWRPEVALTDFTIAIVTASNVAVQMNAANIVRFLALMSFRYQLPGLVTFQETPNGNGTVTASLTVSRRDWIPPMLNASCFACIKSMITAFNIALKADLKASALINFHDKVPAHDSTPYNITTQSIFQSPFRSINPNFWTDILKEFVFPVFPGAKYIIQETGTNLDNLIAYLTRPANQPLAVAYLVTQVVLAVYQRFVGHSSFSGLRRKSHCSSADLQVHELQDSFEAQVVTSSARDDHVREIFDLTKKQVGSDALSSFTFSEEDHKRINEALGSVDILLPQDVAIADKPPPNITFNFPADLLAARSFGFEVQQERVRKMLNDPKLRSYMPDVFRRDNLISIPASMYLMLKFQGKNKLFLNMPIVGVRLARELWSFLLETRTWTDNTMQKIRSFELCFNNLDFSKIGTNITGHNTRLMAAALMSIVKVVEKSKWLYMDHISESVRMSRGQMFYLIFADSLCGDILLRQPVEDVNVPIKNTPDFSEAFGCAPDAAMNSNQSTCRV